MLCKKCCVELTDENWYNSFKKSYNYMCKTCANNRSKSWNRSNKELVAQYDKKAKQKRKDRNRENSKDYYHKRPDVGMWSRAKKRAKEKSIGFDIEVSDVVIPKNCPLLGIELSVSSGNSKDCSPSLDRIDPKLGYIKGNIWVISHKANTVKSDLTLKELKCILSKLSNILEEQ